MVWHKHLTGDTSWQTHAACTRSNVDMFPTDPQGVDHALAVCACCPVREVCGEYALTNRLDDGVWGGMSEAARRRVLRERKAAG